MTRCRVCGLGNDQEGDVCRSCRAKADNHTLPFGDANEEAGNGPLVVPEDIQLCPEDDCGGKIKPINCFASAPNYWRCDTCGMRFHALTGEAMPIEALTPDELQAEFPTTRGETK